MRRAQTLALVSAMLALVQLAQAQAGSADSGAAAQATLEAAAQAAAPATQVPGQVLATGAAAGERSPWYLERGTAPRAARSADDLPPIVAKLRACMRDQRVPGFYDGQFASTVDDADALIRLLRDETIHASLRQIAIMALQEAADGELLAQALEPLILDADEEFRAERDEWEDRGDTIEPAFIQRLLRADVSRHARFALAKDGQPARVLEKIEVMRHQVWRRRYLILDASIESSRDPQVAWLRSVWFSIAYHFQQFDDYDSASRWFHGLCDNLKGDDTRWAHYNLGCIEALQGRPEEAVAQLEQAVAVGFLDVDWITEDGDLASLHGRPDYLALVLRLGGRLNSNDESAGAAPEELGSQP